MNSLAFAPARLAVHLFWVGAVCAAFATWVAFHAHGHDWYATMGQFAIVRHWGWAPFSYHYSGGAGLFQDPQGMMASPSVHALTRILAALGVTTQAIARIWVGLYVGWGAAGMVFWLGRRGSVWAGIIAAVAWCTSLAFLWRIAAGHTPFIMYAWAPWILAATENWLAKPHLRSTLLCSVLAAVTIWEPGFHALFYLILPCVAITLAFHWRKLPPAKLWIVSVIAVTGLTAPRWATWLTLPMTRSRDLNDGVISLRDAFYSLFATARAHNLGVQVYSAAGSPTWQNIWEVAAAMAPLASALAVFGVIRIASYWRLPELRPIVKLAATAVILGILLASQDLIWGLLQSLTSSGIRGPGRFLGLASFGLAIFAGLGGNAALAFIAKRYPTSSERLIPALCALLLIGILALQTTWVMRAMGRGTLSPTSITRGAGPEKPQIIYKTYCSVGSGCLNNFDLGFAESKFDLYLAGQGLHQLDLDDERLKDVEVSPSALRVANVAASTPRTLPFRSALAGQTVLSSDPLADIQISFAEGPMTLTSDRAIEWITVTANPLIPRWSVWIFWTSLLVSASLFWRRQAFGPRA